MPEFDFSTIFIALIVIFFICAIWAKIFEKAGYNPWYCLIMIVPLLNIIVLIWFAFSRWPISESIDKLNRRLSELSEKQHTAVCDDCGAPVAEDDKFCSSCGSEFAKQPNVCPKCGDEVSADDKFCSSCGANLLESRNFPKRQSRRTPKKGMKEGH